jgi:hypothetical protein
MKKLELPKDLPDVAIGKEGQTAWVNVVKFILISTLQVHSAAYLSQVAFPPADEAVLAMFRAQELLALRIDELNRAQDARILSNDVGNASRRLSGQPVDGDDNEGVAEDAAAQQVSDNTKVTGALKNGNRYGDQDLQDFLLQILIQMTSKHHPTLLNDVVPGTFDCGRKALMIIENFIMPKNPHTLEALTRIYEDRRGKLQKSDNIYTAFEKLLQAYYVKMHIEVHFNHGANQSPKPCMDDFLAMLLRAFGADSAVASQWANRTSLLQMQAMVNNQPAMTDGETVRDFQVWLNEFQQKRVPTEKALKSDTEKGKKGNDKPGGAGGRLRQLDIFCSWCFANKDKKFPHDVKDCFSKRKSEAANDTEAKKCEICDDTDHDYKICPFGQL